MKENLIWVRQAEADLGTAKYNLDGKIFYASAFFSQQAIEKILKAYIIYKKLEFRKTHSIVVLAKKVGVSEEFLKKIIKLEEIERISRYPDVVGDAPCDEIKKEDAQDFYNIAEEVLVWVKNKMKS